MIFPYTGISFAFVALIYHVYDLYMYIFEDEICRYADIYRNK